MLGDSRLLPPAAAPLTTPLAATSTLELARPTPGLEPGRPLVLTGVDPAGGPVAKW